MSVTIVEIFRRADQGITRPFLCRGDDDILYYVKGRGAGKRSLCSEWVAGRLAQEMNLSVPDFVIANVPQALVRGSARKDITDLGSGEVFASSVVQRAGEITWTEAEMLSLETKAEVLFFDWWVQNEDRSMSALGGNPNLLMGGPPEARTLWVFDFNLAFEPQFFPPRFWENHLFADMVNSWPPNFRGMSELKAQEALANLPTIFQELPKEWLHLDGDESLPVQLDRKMVETTLARVFTNAFWNRQ